MKNIFIISAAVLVLSSCSFYQVRSQDEGTFVSPAKKFFMDVEYVESTDKPYQVLAELRVKTERNRDLDDVIRKMKMEAAVLGADAVIEVKIDPEMLKKKEFNKKLRVDYIGKAIVYQ